MGKLGPLMLKCGKLGSTRFSHSHKCRKADIRHTFLIIEPR